MEQIQGRNVEEPLLKVDYLDLTIQLENGHFVTQTYQKPINLYQYLTPNLAHPRWTIKRNNHKHVSCLFLSKHTSRRLLEKSNAVLQTVENARLGQKNT